MKNNFLVIRLATNYTAICSLLIGLLFSLQVQVCLAAPEVKKSETQKKVTATEQELVDQGLIPPLPQPPKNLPGFIAWDDLTKQAVTLQTLADKVVKVQGFMFPLDQAEQQSHFLLSVFPPSCGFCLPSGPEGLIEVFTVKPVTFVYDVVGIEGKFEFPKDDPMGLKYRVRNGAQVELK